MLAFNSLSTRRADEMNYARKIIPFLLGCSLGLAALSNAGKANDEPLQPGQGAMVPEHSEDQGEQGTNKIQDTYKIPETPGFDDNKSSTGELGKEAGKVTKPSPLISDGKGGIIISNVKRWECVISRSGRLFYCAGELATPAVGESF